MTPPRSSEQAAPLTPTPEAPPPPSAEDRKEEEIWAGFPDVRAGLGRLALGILIAISVTVGVGLADLAWLSVIGWILSLIAVAWGVAGCVYPRCSCRYRLTSQRLFVSRGLVVRTTDQIELIRVDDIRVRQGPIQRAMGLGDVVILSTDLTDQECVLHGVLAPEKVGEDIRRHNRELRKRSSFVKRL